MIGSDPLLVLRYSHGIWFASRPEAAVPRGSSEETALHQASRAGWDLIVKFNGSRSVTYFFRRARLDVKSAVGDVKSAVGAL